MPPLLKIGVSARHRRALRVETLSTLRQAYLWPRDLSPIVPSDCRPGDDVIVLIHGILSSAGAFRPMRARLEQTSTSGGRVHVASFTHAPGQKVRTIAASLAKLMAKIPHGARVHVVGHSLGGIVARWYVQELGGHQRVTQTLSLGSPFGGAPLAGRLPVLVGADLCVDSPTLRRLRTGPHAHLVTHTSIVAGLDHLVLPASSAAFHHGEVIVLPGRSHNSLLFDEDVVRIVEARVRQASPLAQTG